MPEVCHSAKTARKLSPIHMAAAGYINPMHPIDENANHRRALAEVFYWQCRPQVYPFNAKREETDTKKSKDISMYTSEYFEKPIVLPKIRPSSIYRRNNPHPNVAFHVKHLLNQNIPVVRTKMTVGEFNERPGISPYISDSHRVYRKYEPKEIVRVKPLRKIVECAKGIVPELNKTNPIDLVEDVKLFPAIPRNSRLTADRAQGIAHATVKPHRNKYQPHLSGATSSYSRSSHFSKPEPPKSKPNLKPCKVHVDSFVASSWDGAPSEGAKTRSQVMGRKKADPSKIPDAVKAIVPNLSPPNSKSLMFREYSQYPKYAPQMVQGHYGGGKARKNPLRPYV